MKYKVSDSTASGVGRPRAHPMTSTHPVGKAHKDETSHKARNNKANKNEGGALRRSSRRATIERRVWAIPKKTARLAQTNARGKNAQRPGRKGKEKMTQGRVQVKSFAKSRSPQGTKRGLVTLEEAGNARRKVKKKEGIRDVGSEASGDEVSVGDQNEKGVTAESPDNAATDDDESDHESRDADSCRESEPSVDSDRVSEASKCVSVRTGVQASENAGFSTLRQDDVHDGRIIEETLLTGEMCLSKAVVEEVVPDYEVADPRADGLDAVGGADPAEGRDPGRAYRNLEDVLGHSYSRAKSPPGEVRDERECGCGSPGGAERPEREAGDRGVTNGDQGVKGQPSPCEGEEGLSRTRRLPGAGEPESRGSSRLGCPGDDSREAGRDGKDGEADEVRVESVVVGRENLCSIEKDDRKLSESIICPPGESPVAVPVEGVDSEHRDSEEEEDHVSLSVALARLVDSDNGGEAEGTETVTIHSASSVVQVEEEEPRGMVAVEVKSNDEAREESETQDDGEDEEGELVIKEEDEDEEDGGDTSNDDTEGEEVFGASADGKRDCKIQSCIALVNSEKSEIEAEYEKDADCTDASPSPLPKLKKQIPPLIKISSRPPAIKTPLKCPECPMQFCTVRSLLWHFGTHGARSRENCMPPILLQDLIVPWDKPTVSLFISQSPDSDKSAEKAMSLAETVAPAPAAPALDAAVRQDLTVSAQIVRTEDYLGTNGDVILKVPIPRLKPKAQAAPGAKKDKFVNILPKMTAGDGPSAPSLLKPNSPTPQITIHPQNNRPVDVVTLKPQRHLPKITIRAADGCAAPSQPAVQIRPLQPPSQDVVQPGPKGGAPGRIALIPVDGLAAAGQNPRTSRAALPPPLPAKAPPDGILEKDGLVMINSNLALRIVSSLPGPPEADASGGAPVRPVAGHLPNNLTILPQADGGRLVGAKRDGAKNPDILTIVPQVDAGKKLSLLKGAAPPAGGGAPQRAGSAPSPSLASSQVVKLYLLQPRGDGGAAKFVAEPPGGANGVGAPLPPSSNGRGREDSESAPPGESDEDEDEEGMVIDDEKEGDDDVMDPLSLCAVTMEDENLEAPGGANASAAAAAAAGSDDKVTIKKVPVRAKGKSNQGVDIVKYEARKYVCCYCNRRFGWSTDLKRHVILHTGEKPFQCKVCPTAFTRKFLLQNHMKRMHLDKYKISDLWP